MFRQSPNHIAVFFDAFPNGTFVAVGDATQNGFFRQICGRKYFSGIVGIHKTLEMFEEKSVCALEVFFKYSEGFENKIYKKKADYL